MFKSNLAGFSAAVVAFLDLLIITGNVALFTFWHVLFVPIRAVTDWCPNMSSVYDSSEIISVPLAAALDLTENEHACNVTVVNFGRVGWSVMVVCHSWRMYVDQLVLAVVAGS